MDSHHKDLFFEMLSIPTISRDAETPVEGSDRIVDLIKRELERLGLSVEILEYEKGFPLVFATLDRGARETVLFLVHYDVVPPGEGWETDPFTPVERDGKIFARGASDDKGGIISLLMALSDLYTKDYKGLGYNIKILVLGDEEIGSPHGLCRLLEDEREKLECDVALVMDSGTEGVMAGCSGVLSGEVTIHGKGGHSAYPHRATNPINLALSLGTELLSFSEREESRVSPSAMAPPGSPRKRVWNRFTLTKIASGEKLNVIPSRAVIGFNWRFIPEEDPEERFEDLVSLVRDWATRKGIKGENSKATIEVRQGFGRQGYWIGPENRFVEELCRAVEKETGAPAVPYCEMGATDGIHVYHSLGVPAIGYGPIEPDTNYHGPNEFVRIETLDRVARVFTGFLRGSDRA